MRAAEGKLTREMSRAELESLASPYSCVLVDVGTGDGKFAYRTAQQRPDWLCIGVDADLSSLSEYARKSQRKPERAGVPNALYVVANVEDLPSELDGVADRVTVHLPWGSLLAGIVHARSEVLAGLARVGKIGSEIELLLGYSRKYEAHEMRRRNLPDLSIDFIDEQMSPGFQAAGLRIIERRIVANEELKGIPLTWGRRLAHGRERETFLIRATIERQTERPQLQTERPEPVEGRVAADAVRFTARGHPNITAKHATTFEFTKEPEIGPTADCIIGVAASWKPEDIETIKRFHKARLTITCGAMSESVRLVVNAGFADERELVIRKSNFRSRRTLGVNADKSARQLSRDLAAMLRDPDREIRVAVQALW